MNRISLFLRAGFLFALLAVGILFFFLNSGLWSLDFLKSQNLTHYPGGVRETTFSDNGKNQIESASSAIFFVPAIFYTSGSRQFDGYIELLPSGVGNIGVVGANADIENTISHHRDSDTIFFVSGILNCPAADYSGCQFIVDRLVSIESVHTLPPQYHQVSNLDGIIVSAPGSSPHDTGYFFVSYSNLPVVYTINSEDNYVAQQFSQYADIGRVVQVSGDIAFGDLESIQFSRIEVVSMAPDSGSLAWSLEPEEASSLRSSLKDYYAKTGNSLNGH